MDNDGKAVVVGEAGGVFGLMRLVGDVLPRLSIARNGANVEVSWGTDALGFLLQTKTNVSRGITWSDLPSSRTTNRMIFSPAGNAFYRLKL